MRFSALYVGAAAAVAKYPFVLMKLFSPCFGQGSCCTDHALHSTLVAANVVALIAFSYFVAIFEASPL